jgi:putative oxidoreductase
MITAFLIGRIIVAAYFLINAKHHLLDTAGLVGYAVSKGVPAPKLAVIGSGILLLIGGLSMLFGAFVFWGIAALILFMVPVTFKMHSFWKETDPHAKVSQRIAFQSNMAIVGFLLMMLSVATPWAYSLSF